jgi:hypothetical protein
MINFPNNPSVGEQFSASGKSWEWDGTAWKSIEAGEWRRPVDWLPMPAVEPTDEIFVGLIAVFDSDANYVELSAAGDYTVDWGDGTVEDFDADDVALHQYSYADTDLTDTSATLGYKQALVTVTPQAGQSWTKLSLQEGAVPGNLYDAPVNWLDIVLSGPDLTTITIGLED